MIQKTYYVGIYARLSKDDEKTGESVSIENQRHLLTKYVEGQSSWTLYEVYIDDGWSGTNFERPSFKRMLSDAQDGKINLILVKDLSRLGRNYLEVGQLTDIIFPQLGCRFVALNDNYDSIHNNNDFMPFQNLFNEMHSRDTSKKVKAIKRARAESGKFIGTYAPYGYKKDAENKHRLLIDERTAPVVRRIFEMRKDGMGYYSIASALNDDKIPAPRETWYTAANQKSSASGTGLWADSMIMRLTHNEVYLGHMVQGKQGTISFRNRKVVPKPQEEWIKVEYTHEPIIDIALWDRVQALNQKKHKPRKLVNGKSNMYLGLLKCADCGYQMRYQGRKYPHVDGSVTISGTFLCGNYSRSGTNACTAHSIKEQVINQVVIEDIRRNAKMVAINEEQVINAITAMRDTEGTSRLSAYKLELKNSKARVSELEKRMENMYTDKLNGVMPETLFQTLINKCESERISKIESLKTLQDKISEIESGWSDASQWTTLMKKCINIVDLNAAMLLELIDRIEIGEAKIIDGQRVCDIRIYYVFLEDINISSLDLEVRHEVV